MKSSKRPEKIQTIVERLIKKIDKDNIDMCSAWQKAVDTKLRKHARPVGLHAGVLTINVENSGWLYILTIDKEKLLNKIRAQMPTVIINDIRFRIGEA